MRFRHLCVGSVLALTAVSPTPALADDGTPEPVIVLMADQQPLTAQVPLLDRINAKAVHRFSVLNGFAAKLTSADQAKLAADPRVKAVVPDLIVKRPKPVPEAEPTGASATVKAPLSGTCPADPAKPLLEPEALRLTNAEQPQATGQGVKVAFLADSVDIRNPDFQRADGSAVFADYKDFSGEGPDTPNSAREAFGDASAIAAQGRQAYDLSEYVNPASPLPQGCTIKIRGVAPGASLVGLKTSGDDGAPTSTIVQAIEYAVKVAKVDVINESLGGNPYPDRHTDPMSLANQAAVAAGVTVVAASGDAGFNNTIGNPAGDPAVISVGASTAFRVNAQTQRGMPGLTGFTSGNIASISSGGVTEGARTLDLVAPGDQGWSVCTPDPARFTGCRNFRGAPSPIFNFGGTSQSAPLVAGAAALVIEAYASAHYGEKPKPALIKRLLTSTATDLGDRAEQQGAGLLNAGEAVLAAKSQGDTLRVEQTQLSATAAPGSAKDFALTVTNTGTRPQTVSPRTSAFTKVLADTRGSVELDATTSPQWTSGSGTTFGFVTKKFTVAPGAEHLDFSLAFSPSGGNSVNLRLLDPQGSLTAVYGSQGDSGFGHVEVHAPIAGTWTALFDSKAAGGYRGSIAYGVRASASAPLGTVSPASATVAPGQSQTFHVLARTPDAPGDVVAAVRVGRSVVPMVLRSLVKTTFSGVLTGGNGRDFIAAQNSFYQFDVPAGRRDFGINLKLAGDPNQMIFGYLVSPDGQILSQQNNVRTLDGNGNPATFGATLQEFRRDPAPGRWTFIVAVSNPVAGTTTEQKFTGELKFDTVDVRAIGLPSGAVLPAGTPVTARVEVRNTGNAPLSYFADARSTATGNVRLLANGPEKGVPLPIGRPLIYLVPPATTKLTGTAAANAPVDVSLIGFLGGPELLRRSGPDYVANAAVSSPAVAPGPWLLAANTVGSGDRTADFKMVATTRLFDKTVTTSTGNAWLGASEPNPPAFTPLVLQPGQSGTITVTLNPGAASGTKVSGVLYVDDFSDFATTGDELKAFPYSYTVR
ncbi:Peptidase inhibitor I9 [Amycolatopsis xylanica]|uniref:Peptidase inhibitor I9 n=1 Tax=Amycolatopsis xylanica TaxID=589385 RepID=A0A1H3P5R4_9PSEU|nr:S8 family serine peptidase [Amycolatopsis xylanica]SDY96303.1 Peptidase inhibitor I9 [Amycolatopsis xylanica]